MILLDFEDRLLQSMGLGPMVDRMRAFDTVDIECGHKRWTPTLHISSHCDLQAVS